jgi:hypothetical protein
VGEGEKSGTDRKIPAKRERISVMKDDVKSDGEWMDVRLKPS